MKLTFLGTSSAKPSALRSVSGMLLAPFGGKELWLFDCGDGTQLRALQAGHSLEHIRRIFISHMHGDHIFGLPGFLASLSLSSLAAPVELYGPEPLEKFLDMTRSFSGSLRPRPYDFHALAEGELTDLGGIRIGCRLLDHREVFVLCAGVPHGHHVVAELDHVGAVLDVPIEQRGVFLVSAHDCLESGLRRRLAACGP